MTRLRCQIGLGDISPQNPTFRLLSVVLLPAGLVILSFLLAAITTYSNAGLSVTEEVGGNPTPHPTPVVDPRRPPRSAFFLSFRR